MGHIVKINSCLVRLLGVASKRVGANIWSLLNSVLFLVARCNNIVKGEPANQEPATQHPQPLSPQMAIPSLRCQTCHDIIDFIQHPKENSIDLGHLLDESDSHCKQHSALIWSLRPRSWTRLEKQIEVELCMDKSSSSEVNLQYYASTSHSNMGYTSGPLLVTPSDENCLPQTDARNLGRAYDAAWIDLTYFAPGRRPAIPNTVADAQKTYPAS